MAKVQKYFENINNTKLFKTVVIIVSRNHVTTVIPVVFVTLLGCFSALQRSGCGPG